MRVFNFSQYRMMCKLFNVYKAIILVIFIVNAGSSGPDSTKGSEAIANPYEPELIRVIAVFRHGIRAPVKSTNPDVDPDKVWPEGPGQLTKLGKMAMYNLGQRIRERYGRLLHEHNNRVEKDVRSTSTDVARSVQSASVLLAGLYPPDKKQTWNKALPWQPMWIPTDSPDRTQIVDGQGNKCPLYQVELMRSVNVTSNDPMVKSLIDYFNEAISPAKISSMFELGNIVDTVFCEIASNIKVPKWIDSIVKPNLTDFVDLEFGMLTRTYNMKRLLAGPLIGDISKQLQMRPTDPNYSKFYLYSGHDTTVHSLIRSMNLTDEPIRPDFGSGLFFEVYRYVGSQFVKIYYNPGTNLKDLVEMSLPGCNSNSLCEVEEFVNMTSHLVPTDWHRECQL